MAEKLIVMLPSITGILYLATSVAFFSKKDWGFGIAYFAYALANVGLIIASMK